MGHHNRRRAHNTTDSAEDAPRGAPAPANEQPQGAPPKLALVRPVAIAARDLTYPGSGAFAYHYGDVIPEYDVPLFMVTRDYVLGGES